MAEQEALLWDGLGTIDPHDAAHIGRAVPAPVRPLAAFDPGIMEVVGTSVFIEGHAQNPARHRPMDGGAALSRSNGFSAAWALQVVMPLLIILSGFTTMSGEPARARLRQELGTGASVSALVGGRLLALTTASAALLVVMLAVSLPAILVQGADASALVRLAAISAGYILYLFAFCALTVAASGLFASARATLVALLGFWVVATLLVPRVAPTVAELVAPTPSAPAFQAALKAEADRGIDVHDPNDEGSNAFTAALLERFGVGDVSELPINFRGAKYEYGEVLSSALYNRHFDQLYSVYREQAQVQRGFALLSPTMAIKPWSRALATTDVNAHLGFLRTVEDYRFRLIQTLNAALKHTSSQPGGSEFPGDIATITRHIHYHPRQQAAGAVVAAQWPDFAILFVWSVGAVALLGLSMSRLGRRS